MGRSNGADYGDDNELSNDHAARVVFKQVKGTTTSCAVLLWLILVLVGLMVLQQWSLSGRLSAIEAAVIASPR